MTLGFQQKFLPIILDGRKIHTIRKDQKNRWKAGRKIHFATGVRTSEYNQFMTGVCTGVQDINIMTGEIYHITINGRQIENFEISDLVKNDGFETLYEFYDFFEKTYGRGLFEGKLIHWTDYRYGVIK